MSNILECTNNCGGGSTRERVQKHHHMMTPSAIHEPQTTLNMHQLKCTLDTNRD